MKNKSIKIIISVILISLSYGFIAYKIIHFNKLSRFDFYALFNSSFNLVILTLVILLMIINWSVETIKWKILMNTIQPLGFYNALKAVLSGITIGIFTPNRVGEIGGRVLFLKKGNRTYGLLATGLGSFAQIITTTVNGLLALALFQIIFASKADINPALDKISTLIILLLLIVLILIYFNSRHIMPLLLKFSFFKTRKKQLDYFSKTKFLLLLKVLALSQIRYGIFMFQFFLLLLCFNVELSFSQAYISIALIYLFAALIPTTTLVELGIRGSLSIFFIGIFSENVLGIILSTMLLWIINLAVPSIIGSFFLVKKNLPLNN